MTSKQFTKPIQEKVSSPLPLLDSNGASSSIKKDGNNTTPGYRIWIGNMDPRLNEYSLLQLLKSYGNIQDIDCVVHKFGIKEGASKGYGFVTFKEKESAKKAIKGLHGKQVLAKELAVRWAHEHDEKKYVKPAPALLVTPFKRESSSSVGTTPMVPTPAVTSRNAEQYSKASLIAALEQKIRGGFVHTPDDDEETTPKGQLHPLLQKAKERKQEEEARKKRRERRGEPYRRNNRGRGGSKRR